uniref:Uncharacterized protein n=1 Tax=viral metagenome TaxID=1070528 RepID=A0A6C0JQP5_9ZZZZ
MLEFSENILNAGKNAGTLDLSDRFLGTFYTSGGGYVSGAQPTLNALTRILMTFGDSHIGGGNWKSGQGACGMVKDDKDGINWAWNPSMKYLQDDATAYGERLGALASFYQDSYNNSMKNPPTTPQKVIKCNGGKKCGVVPLLLALMGVLVLVLIILLLINKK